MKAQLVHAANEHERSFVLALGDGDEPMSLLSVFAERERLGASRITGIGAFASCVLGYFDRDRKTYRRIAVDEQTEVLSLVGDVADHRGKPVVHLHVVVGRFDGTTRGGHLLEARVWPTLEIVVTEWPAYLRKEFDPEVGLPLLPSTSAARRARTRAEVDDVRAATLLHDLHPGRPE